MSPNEMSAADENRARGKRCEMDPSPEGEQWELRINAHRLFHNSSFNLDVAVRRFAPSHGWTCS